MATTYQIDPAHSTAKFSVKHMMVAKVHGGFKNISGTFCYDSEKIEQSSVDVSIDASSIDTRDEQRDSHLKGVDFFNAEKFPTITFKSIRFEQNQHELLVTGNLTIHGVTKKITLQVKAPGKELKGLSGKTKIRRKDFGLIWHGVMEAAGILVGDEISINFEVGFQ